MFNSNFKKYKDKYLGVLLEGENKKILLIATLLTTLILIIEIVKMFTFTSGCVTDGSGKIIGISRPKGSKNEDVKITAEVFSNRKVKEIPINIHISGEDKIKTKDSEYKGGTKSKIQDKSDKQEQLEVTRELQHAVRALDKEKSKLIKLPSRLKGKERVTWRVDKKLYFPKALLLMPMVPIALISYRMSEEKNKKNKLKEDIKWGIPNFTHQVVIYMNSGIIISDIIPRLYDRYKVTGGKNPIEKMVINACERGDNIQTFPINLLAKEAENSGISEFIRIVAIILEGQIRGLDIRYKLENESKILWHDRKKAAEEKGHLAESKLAIPLSLLLVVLMIITAAPAMMGL